MDRRSATVTALARVQRLLHHVGDQCSAVALAPVAATAAGSGATVASPLSVPSEVATDVERGKRVGAALVDLVTHLQQHLPSKELHHLDQVVLRKFDEVYQRLEPMSAVERSFFDEIRAQVVDVLVRFVPLAVSRFVYRTFVPLTGESTQKLSPFYRERFVFGAVAGWLVALGGIIHRPVRLSLKPHVVIEVY